jgi:hypothetical protein
MLDWSWASFGSFRHAPKEKHAVGCVLYAKTAGTRTKRVAMSKAGISEIEGSCPTIANPFYEYL